MRTRVHNTSLYPNVTQYISGSCDLMAEKAVPNDAYDVFTDEFEEEELFPEDALSNHTDMVDNEPVINEAKRKFIR